jgi:hypothetical protein
VYNSGEGKQLMREKCVSAARVRNLGDGQATPGLTAHIQGSINHIKRFGLGRAEQQQIKRKIKRVGREIFFYFVCAAWRGLIEEEAG